MAEPQNISSILAALNSSGGAPNQASQHPPAGSSYPPSYPPERPANGGSAYPLPQPVSSGSVDLSTIKPVSSGSVSIADAIQKARGFAAERGVQYDANRVQSRAGDDSRRRPQRSRSRSRSPVRAMRGTFRDNYNPYRDERRGGQERQERYPRDRTLSPRPYDAMPPQGRPYEPDNRASMERATGDNETERLSIDKSFVGLIIGRAGENLRRVEQTTGARVQFRDGPDSSGAVRLCDISGSRQARERAKAEIYRIMDEHGPGRRGAQEQPRPQARPMANMPVDEIEGGTQIMVPDRTVGLIIGRGGETIRDLQERSGCHVNIVAENKSVGGLRPVNLVGSQECQQMAKNLIMEIVESDSRSTAARQEQPRGGFQNDSFGEKLTDSIMVPGDSVGMIIGKGGESIKEMQSSTGCKINVSQPSGRDVEREIGLVGSRQAIEMAKGAIMEKVNTVQENRNRAQGRDHRSDDPYRGGDYERPQQQAYPSAAPQQQGPPAAGGEDPYAAYGGYNNYVAMWYAAMAQQQQGAGEQAGPPGA